jgi:hypothetical protein
MVAAATTQATRSPTVVEKTLHRPTALLGIGPVASMGMAFLSQGREVADRNRIAKK